MTDTPSVKTDPATDVTHIGHAIDSHEARRTIFGAWRHIPELRLLDGIGENDGRVRKQVCEYLGYLGITIDDEANSRRGEDVVISTPDSKVKVAVLPTNEELAICRDTVALVK